MMRRIKLGWNLTKKSWSVLKENRSLLLFPIISGITSLIFLLVIPIGAIVFTTNETVDLTAGNNGEYVAIAATVLVAYITTIVTIFFNVALASAVIEIFHGKEGSIKTGIALAWQRKGAIIGWALVTATVGLLLRLIAEKVPAGGLIEAIGGFTWAVASWFVVPSLAVEGKGPWQSLKASARTIKARWGEGVVGIVSIGGIIGILLFASIMITVFGAFLLVSVSAPISAFVLFGLIAFLVIVSLSLIASTLRQIFNVAVFLSIKENNRDVGPFTNDEISNSVIYKKGGSVTI